MISTLLLGFDMYVTCELLHTSPFWFRAGEDFLSQSNPCTKRYNTGDENSSLCFAEDQ